MSYPVNLQALPAGVFQEVFNPDNTRERHSGNNHTTMSFPKSRTALWDGSTTGESLHLQLCSQRKPRVQLLEKALRLAQRHARHSNKPQLHCFFLGSVSVDSDEEGVTISLDRFDPGRDQSGASARVPSALLPGDVLVPCFFSSQSDSVSDTVVQTEADLHLCFKVLQQYVSSRQTLDLSQLLKVKGHVLCRPQSDAAAFTVSWSAVAPAVGIEVQPVRPVPIIPTALVRSLTSLGRPPPRSVNHQRGFLTMDQTRKLLLLLESDPKVSNLPVVGLWISGVTQVCNPQVWLWCLRFLYSAALQDRVLSESGCFLLVMFGSTHRAPQFFQCRGPKPGAAQLDYQLLSASQSFTLYQVAPVDGQTVQCVLMSELQSRRMQVFREAQRSFKGTAQPGATSLINDQDSGVEDEDLSPRPSPSPHLPAQQCRRVQPSVPELSLLVDDSITSSNQTPWQEASSSHTHHPPPPRRRSVPPPPPSAPNPPRHYHSTPNSNAQQSCACCSSSSASPPHNCTTILPHNAPPSSHDPHNAPPSSHDPFLQPHLPSSCHLTSAPSIHPSPLPGFAPPTTRSTPSSHSNSASHLSHKSSPPRSLPPPSAATTAAPCYWSHPSPVPWCGDSSPSPHPASPPCHPVFSQQHQVVHSDVRQLLLQQDQQLRLLQAQVQMLLEAQSRLPSSQQQADTQTPRSTVSVAVGTGASLCWTDPGQPREVTRSRAETQTPPSTPRNRAACSSPEPPFTARPSLTPPSSGPASTPPAPSTSSSPRFFTHTQVGTEDRDDAVQGPQSSTFSFEGLQSPVLGESASMYNPEVQQPNFYQDLMTQLTSRLQEPDSPHNHPDRQPQEKESRGEPEPLGRRSLPVVSQSTRKKQKNHQDDPVVSATLRRLQQLGVSVDREDILDSDRRIQKTVESTSTLACINPAAVLSRLGVSEQPGSLLFPGGSVDLSLEANAIALRYLNDAQLSRLSLEGHPPAPVAPTSSTESLLSPSNMSIATRKYMRRYGLIEEEEDEEEESEEDFPLTLHQQPLAQSQNIRLPGQSELIRDLRPKMQLLTGGGRSSRGKENSPNRRPLSARVGSLQTEGSVGNILDLSRLRQLPKLF